MAGIGGLFKGVKAAFSKNIGGKTGLYKNAAGKVKAKPGFELAKGVKGGGTTKKAGFGNMLARNPGKTAAVGAAGLVGGGLLLSSSGSSSQPSATTAEQGGQQSYGYA